MWNSVVVARDKGIHLKDMFRPGIIPVLEDGKEYKKIKAI